ncbi:hypothetical protein KP509_1Z044000 [Ceratopteris richardii]|nr:hypothetical protein KP509_1Z044000 [Ceratopteris richardii]
MLDLNETPRSASDCLVDGTYPKVVTVSTDKRFKNSEQSEHGSIPNVSKDCDDASTITAETSAKLLATRSSLTSNLTLESSLERQLSKTSPEHLEEIENEERRIATSNFLQTMTQKSQIELHEDLKEDTDQRHSVPGAVYQFMSSNTFISPTTAVNPTETGITVEHELLKEDRQDYDRTSSFSTYGSAVNLSLGDASTSAVANFLSLGGSATSSQVQSVKILTRPPTSSRNAGVFTLGSLAQRSIEMGPFWQGKLFTDVAFSIPLDAFNLGPTEPRSQLKKIASNLISKKILKPEEFVKILKNGVIESLIKLKFSLEASLEEVKRFKLMVEALSHGSKIFHCSMLLGSDLGGKKTDIEEMVAYPAALVSWREEDLSVDTNLYLVSSQGFSQMLKNGYLSSFLCALDEMDELDSEYLYGVFCSSSFNPSKDVELLNHTVDNDGSRVKLASSNRKLDTSLSIASLLSEKRKDRIRSTSPDSRGSPHLKNQSGRSDVLTETKRLSTRDTILASVSRRRLEKQASSIEHNRDSRSRHLVKHSDDLYIDDFDIKAYQKSPSKQRESFGRNLSRHSDRLERCAERDKDITRSSKEDRTREHRSSHHGSERASKSKSKEEHRIYDRLASHKERDKYSRDKVTESLKEKLQERGSSRNSVRRAASPDEDYRKVSKKREREDDAAKHLNLKRPRDLEGTVRISLGQETCDDSKSKVSVEKIDKEECSPLIHVEHSQKSLLNDPRGDPLLLNDSTVSVSILEMKDKEPLVLDEDLTKPLLVHRNFKRATEGNKNAMEMPIVEAEGMSEMDSLKMSLMEPSWHRSLEDSILSKDGKEEQLKATLEVVLDGSIDKETRTWLISKQNSLYLHEEYGVDAEIICTSSGISMLDLGSKTDGSNVTGSDVLMGNSGVKVDVQNGPLHMKISMTTSDICDAAEAKWFVEQAATILKIIAVRGVHIKYLWYEGPIQIHEGDGAPSVPVIAKKIKGEDGKNLERIQDKTGVMIGVVLRKTGVSTSNESEPVARPRFIGLRLKCIRRKGLLEAVKEAEALLESVAEHFSTVLATHIATHIADLQETDAAYYGNANTSLDPSLSLVLSTKEFLSNSPVKKESHMYKSPSGSLCKVDETLVHDDGTSMKLSGMISPVEEQNNISDVEPELVSRTLCVTNLPENMTSERIGTIVECVLKEKFSPSFDDDNDASTLVVNVRLKPDEHCAFVQLINNHILRASLKLYEEDNMVFHGLDVEGFVPLHRVEGQGSFSRGATRNMELMTKSSFVGRSKEEDHSGKLQSRVDDESESDFSHDTSYGANATRTDYDRPRPLYLTELMRNASSPAIKQLFEDVITTYIGPSLVSSSGKELILDVRYVPTRGCAFVDLATPELVEFMLDLHSRRPEVFMNMKMELGRKVVPFSAEDDGDKRLNLWSRNGKHGYRLTSSGSSKKLENRPSGAYVDYNEDSDKGDDLGRHMLRLKRQRSDPEKTIYADRLPENASVGMIKRIFERVLLQNLTREEREAIGEQQLITEVRHVPSKYCAFVVFANEELARLVLELYNQEEDIFECMRLKPHFHSRLEDLYKDDLQEMDEVARPAAALRERLLINEIDEFLSRHENEHRDSRSSRLAVQRAISATAFKEVDRRRSVYVDRIPEDLNEASMTQLFEKVFRHRRHGYDGRMVSQVAYFRDKFDPSKLCAFVEIRTEEGTKDLVDFYNANQDVFHGMRIRPGFKYNT